MISGSERCKVLKTERKRLTVSIVRLCIIVGLNFEARCDNFNHSQRWAVAGPVAALGVVGSNVGNVFTCMEGQLHISFSNVHTK